MPDNKSNQKSDQNEWLWQFSVAALYLLLGRAVHHYIINHGIVSIFWPGSGLALAAVLLGGKRYLSGVFWDRYS